MDIQKKRMIMLRVVIVLIAVVSVTLAIVGFRLLREEPESMGDARFVMVQNYEPKQ